MRGSLREPAAFPYPERGNREKEREGKGSSHRARPCNRSHDVFMRLRRRYEKKLPRAPRCTSRRNGDRASVLRGWNWFHHESGIIYRHECYDLRFAASRDYRRKENRERRFSTVSQDFSKEKLRVRGLHRVIDIWKSVERSFRRELGIMAGGIRWLLTSRR